MGKNTIFSNPFITSIAKGNDFCDREKELAQMKMLIQGGQNIVLCSSRRYGKTSLVKRLLEHLKEQKYLTVYADFFSVTSEQDFVTKFANAIAVGIGRGARPNNSFKHLVNMFKSFKINLEPQLNGTVVVSAQLIPGIPLEEGLNDVMENLFNYVERNNRKACCVLDEFQEISLLPNSKKIEGILREHIQQHKSISFVYIGSKYHLLLDMFSKDRPLFETSTIIPLKKIDKNDFAPYIVKKFSESNKVCNLDVASLIYDYVKGYPIYVQRLAGYSWNLTESVCTQDIVNFAWDMLLDSERTLFEETWVGLYPGQRLLLKAIALEPTSEPSSADYLRKHFLIASSLEKAMKTLKKREIIELDKNWHLSDPILEALIKDVRDDTI